LNQPLYNKARLKIFIERLQGKKRQQGLIQAEKCNGIKFENSVEQVKQAK
jgi:hypothetical protein